jgi:hypothetical protein
MRIQKLLSIVLGVACGCATISLKAEMPGPISSAATVLTAHALWGKDFPALLAHLRAWSGAREPSILVFADHVAGATPFRTAEEAQRRLEDLSKAMTERPAPVPPFVEMLQGVKMAPFRADVSRLPDDRSYRLAWTGVGLEFLAKGLTVTTVHQTLGAPESVRREAVPEPEGGEKPPVILTLHRYARGAVVFAESDWSPPGTVDRVLLDVAAASAAVFGRAP